VRTQQARVTVDIIFRDLPTITLLRLRLRLLLLLLLLLVGKRKRGGKGRRGCVEG
jgi:hypothetical protein